MTLRLTFFIAAAMLARTTFAQLFGGQQIISNQPNLYSDAYGIAGNIHIADLDGDEDMDVLWVSIDDHAIVWLENLGDGSFGAQHTLTGYDFSWYRPLCTHPVDIDADGDIDVISVEDGQIGVFRNLSDGNFAYQVINLTDWTDGVYSSFVTSGDLDGDGDIDLVMEDQGGGAGAPAGMVWMKNICMGHFGSEQYFNNDDYGGDEIVATDLDEDSDIDLLVRTGTTVAWYENLG